MDVKLSIVIPTLGRMSLGRTLASCRDADEVVVVLDTARGTMSPPCELPPNVVFSSGHFGVTGGHAGRAHGIALATGTHLAFMDDDDIYTPGAIQLMREAACDKPVIFRMDHYRHGILWADPAVRFGNVSTQMYVVPNDPARLGTWEPHIPGIKEPGGDYTFIAGCVDRMGGPVWRDEVIAVLRPDEPRQRVTVVTPWLAHHELRDDYLECMKQGPWPHEVIVVNNGDAPDLPGCRVIDAGANLGFSRGSNLGLAHATGDIVVFLNNDIAPIEYGWLTRLAEAVEPDVLVGQLCNRPHADVDGVSFPYLVGWCLAGMRTDLVELGGFDEQLEEPAYFSDNLLCLEARAAGMTLREARLGIAHKLNTTAGPAHDPHVQAASAKNRERYQARARELLVPA